MKKTTVVLLHAPRKDDPYEAACREAGFEPVSAPVLRFERVHRDELHSVLVKPDRYAGLVVTSPRAVEALADALVWLPGQSAEWEGKAVFAVGPRTAEGLRELGFVPKGEKSGGADELAERIAQQSFEKPLLFLCGNRRRDTLPNRLEEQGIALEELCVYETHLREDLRLPDAAAWLVFFSPSGVEAARRAGLVMDGTTRRAALGPTTANALRQAGWVADAVADAPTPAALNAALQENTPAAS